VQFAVSVDKFICADVCSWTSIGLLYFIASNVIVGSQVLTQGQKDFLSFFLISLLLYALYYGFWSKLRVWLCRLRGKQLAINLRSSVELQSLDELYERVRGAGGVWGEGFLQQWLDELSKRPLQDRIER
jgi:hypothetical protein